MKDLEQFSTCIGQKEQNLFMIYVTGMIKRNMTKKKKKKMRENLKIDEKVLVLAEKIRKKSAPGKFNSLFKIYLSLTKRKYFSLEKSKKIDKISYYWLKDSQNKKLTKRF